MTATYYSSIFNTFCFLGAGILSSYWIYKFVIEDEDLCLVDYETLEKEEMSSTTLPMLSLCFREPFREDKLKEVDPSLNSSSYLEYLKGEVSDDIFKNVEYENVTMNLQNHYKGSFVNWKNGSRSKYTAEDSDKILQRQNHISFSGFIDRKFFKCFGMEVKTKLGKKLKYISHTYNQSGILDDLKNMKHNVMFIYLHYPNQLLLANQNVETFTNKLNGTGYEIWFTIRGYEVLKRRNRRSMLCEERWDQFDDLTKEEHVQSYGCKPPYIDHKSMNDICFDNTRLKDARYDVDIVDDKYLNQPCEEMSKINFGYIEEFNWKKEKWWIGNDLMLISGYPRKVKVIKQSKAIDPNSLLGVIGGYIGLFLGT